LNNLINNALKFTEKGCVTLKAEVNEGKVLIKVVDTGIGIPKEKQEIVWEEFRQGSEGLSRSFQGTGLGLTLVKKYTDLMEGTISLISEVGEGSTFIFELPSQLLDSVQTKKNSKKSNKEKKGGTKMTDKSLKNILYVEDDNISVQYVTLILKEKYNVEVAATAETVLEALKSKQFDLILMDINLSKGMDGVQLTELIRETIPGCKDLPIIAVTAYAMNGDKEEFLKRGMSGYISKPYAKKDMLALLERVLS
jgi:CheY-like chemotaxis protein